jgi:C4-dicarboxylate-specific signal transduction histidine kinase
VPNGRRPVLADLCVAEQVLAILFDNAVHWLSTTRPPRVLKAKLSGSGLTLENNGPAIRPEHRDLIFEPHFTTREDAAGLGLALARDLLKPIGGCLALRPRRSRGATFELTFAN